MHTPSEASARLPAARLSTYYFFYFTLFGTLLPFFGLYMQSLGFSAWQIGQVMAVLIGTKIVAPYIWGWLADQTGHMMRWVRVCIGFASLASIGLLWTQSFEGVLLVVALFSFFWHGGLPLFEAYTFSQLGSQKARYGKVRLWGSIGFIVAVLALGELFTRWELAGFPWVILGLFVALWLTSWTLKDHAQMPTDETDNQFWVIARSPIVWSLLAVSFLIQFSHGTYYNFFSIDLASYGYSKSLIAGLWALGVTAEIFVFFWMVHLFAHYRVRALILASLILTLIRWQMNIWGIESLSVMMLAQLLHAASFGLFHAAALHLIDSLFYGANRGRGQALYATASQGLGGALGALGAGLTWTLGGAMLSYMVSSLAVFIGLIIAWRWLRPVTL
ncbi:MFS transporter [Thiomicrospira sp.]|uniref:MFS transporter n=1 Tax=Thiomicrospira sp. TaxID=935 RepID=UPI0025E9E712|nr:MFS transporter [Thiomicrospira sp.]